MTRRLRAIAQRRLDDRERVLVFLVAAVVLLAGAIALAMLSAGGDRSTATAHRASASPAPTPTPSPAPADEDEELGPARVPSEEGHSRAANRVTRQDLAELRATAGVFLDGYLPYTYGQAPAREIRVASPTLVRELERNPPRVPPAVRRRHARVVLVQVDAASRRAASVTAMIDDGAGPYNVSVELVRLAAGWQVQRLL